MPPPEPGGRVVAPGFGAARAERVPETVKWGSLQRWVIGFLFACFILLNLGVFVLVAWVALIEAEAVRARTLDPSLRIVTTPVLLALIAASATQLGLTAYAIGRRLGPREP